jgi:hypothetical protein
MRGESIQVTVTGEDAATLRMTLAPVTVTFCPQLEMHRLIAGQVYAAIAQYVF